MTIFILDDSPNTYVDHILSNKTILRSSSFTILAQVFWDVPKIVPENVPTILWRKPSEFREFFGAIIFPSCFPSGHKFGMIWIMSQQCLKYEEVQSRWVLWLETNLNIPKIHSFMDWSLEQWIGFLWVFLGNSRKPSIFPRSMGFSG